MVELCMLLDTFMCLQSSWLLTKVKSSLTIVLVPHIDQLGSLIMKRVKVMMEELKHQGAEMLLCVVDGSARCPRSGSQTLSGLQLAYSSPQLLRIVCIYPPPEILLARKCIRRSVN